MLNLSNAYSPLSTLGLIRLFRFPLLAFFALALQSCKTIDLDLEFQGDPELLARIIDQTEDAFPEIDPLYISQEVKDYVDSIIDPGDGEETRVEKIQNALFGEEFLNVQYVDDRTHTAMEAFDGRAGNCLAVTHLYIAMARYARLNVGFQTVKVRPSWDRRGDLLVLSQHVNARGNINLRRHFIVDFTPEVTLQQLTEQETTDLEARALFFNNLGIEALIEREFEQALAYIKNALFLDPDLSIAWNSLGTAYNLTQEYQLAEFSYQMAFLNDSRSVTSINNLARFYRARGDEDKSLRYREAIRSFNERNPYFHFAQGNIALENEEYDEAARRFRRAMRLKEVEPDFYFALAQTHLALGNTEDARRWQSEGNDILLANEQIYQPSNQRVRFIDSDTILRDTSPGITVYAPK